MKVLFDMARGQISIEGDGPELISVLQHAREIAPKLAEIRLITGPVKNAPSGEDDVRREGSDTDASEAAKGSAPRQGVATLREFVKLVSPNNLADQIPTIGGYQARYHGHDTFSPKQMADWFTHSGLQKPAQMPVALWLLGKPRPRKMESIHCGRECCDQEARGKGRIAVTST
jgi:hypothetical protein